MAGHMPPESCHPPPEPPSHSPKVVLPTTSILSSSVNSVRRPSVWPNCPVNLASAIFISAKSIVLIARPEPMGIVCSWLWTYVTNSIPLPLPTRCVRIFFSVTPLLLASFSKAGGTTPDDTSAACKRLRSVVKLNTSSNVLNVSSCMPCFCSKSTDLIFITGSSMTRTYDSQGGWGSFPEPSMARSVDTFMTLASSGEPMAIPNMSLATVDVHSILMGALGLYMARGFPLSFLLNISGTPGTCSL